MLTFDDFKMMMNEIDYEIDWLSSKLKSIDVQKVLYRMGFPDNYMDIIDKKLSKLRKKLIVYFITLTRIKLKILFKKFIKKMKIWQN